MKLQSTADGLKAVKVNPYSINPDRTYPLMGEDNIRRAMEAFEANNAELPLTQQMPGNTVFEGVEVWQAKGHGAKHWFTDTTGQSKFNSFIDYQAHMKPLFETKQCYQPIQIKETTTEEAAEKAWYYQFENGVSDPTFDTGFKMGANWQATQQQGLVSLESVVAVVENEINIHQHIDSVDGQYTLDVLYNIQSRLKTLKQ